jgi:hypothetical protein
VILLSIKPAPSKASRMRRGCLLIKGDQKGRPALLRQIAAELNAKSIQTARGRKWNAAQMKRVMARG